MITVKFTIPELREDFTPSTPHLYLWFAYFWADIHTLSTPQPISVFVPPSSDTRNAYPELDQVLLAVPSGFGTFQVNLDDGGAGFDAAGVLALVLGQHDTPDDAISAGYAAFATAVSKQLNSFVENNGPVEPTPDQIGGMVKAIRDAVTSAIRNKLSDWDKFLTSIGQETQDEFIGQSHAFFRPGQLTAPQKGTPLNMPAIENQIEYTFPFATLDVQSLAGSDPCQQLVVAANQAITKVTNVTSQLHQLQSEFARANASQRAALKIDIQEILNTSLPAAKKALSNAQRALEQCRFENGMMTSRLRVPG